MFNKTALYTSHLKCSEVESFNISTNHSFLWEPLLNLLYTVLLLRLHGFDKHNYSTSPAHGYFLIIPPNLFALAAAIWHYLSLSKFSVTVFQSGFFYRLVPCNASYLHIEIKIIETKIFKHTCFTEKPFCIFSRSLCLSIRWYTIWWVIFSGILHAADVRMACKLQFLIGFPS